ncbi:MAG TPA: hypothetical protein VN660_01085 [Steroidobacteraceae bacterium]|nr:hypothetical protein [Steroidobacteraceae bacterium]
MEQNDLAGLMAASGSRASAFEDRARALGDPFIERSYYDEGIALIAKHLGLTAEFRGILETEFSFWFELAITLLQTHVPYFMPPARPGAPSTLKSLFPLLEMYIAGIKKDGNAMSVVMAHFERSAALQAKQAQELGIPIMPPRSPVAPRKWTIEQAYADIAKHARCSPETVEREFAKWKGQKRPGGNSAK